MGMQIGKSGLQADLNVTPFIDILLVLLIIFMVTLPLNMMQHSLDVPEKSEEELPEEIKKEQVVLTYTQDDEVFINKEKLEETSPDKLNERLVKIFQNRKTEEKTVFLNIDPKANYGKAMNIVDTVRNSGVLKLAVITLKDDEKFTIPSGPTLTTETGDQVQLQTTP